MSHITERRHVLIVEEVERRQAVSIRDLCERLGVTRETIRKDLAQLAERRLLRQVRGGAMRIEAEEPPLSDRAVTNRHGKQAIGRAVAWMIPDDASVILDSGSTTQAAAEAMLSHRGLTVYTNDISIALRLRGTARAVHLLGGRIAEGEDSTHGLDAIEMMARYNADFAVIGVGGLSAEQLVTDFTREGAALRARMIESARRAILSADHSKFGRIAPVRLPKVALVERLVTDRQPAEAIRDALRALGLGITVAG